MTDAELETLATKLAPIMASRLVETPSFYGNKKRFHVSKNVNLGNCHFNMSSGDITIGMYSFFGYNCSVVTGTHYYNKKGAQRHGRPKYGNDIVIGQGVWIGSGAIILGPCTIGDNSVIGANSVVVPGIYEADSLYVGSPAKLKRKINFE